MTKMTIPARAKNKGSSCFRFPEHTEAFVATLNILWKLNSTYICWKISNMWSSSHWKITENIKNKNKNYISEKFWKESVLKCVLKSLSLKFLWKVEKCISIQMQSKLLISVVHLCVFPNQDFPLKASHVCNSWQFWLVGMRETSVHAHKQKWQRTTLFHSCEMKLTLQAFKCSKPKILFSWLDFKMVSRSLNLIYWAKVLTDHPKNCDNVFVVQYFGTNFVTFNENTMWHQSCSSAGIWHSACSLRMRIHIKPLKCMFNSRNDLNRNSNHRNLNTNVFSLNWLPTVKTYGGKQS